MDGNVGGVQFGSRNCEGVPNPFKGGVAARLVPLDPLRQGDSRLQQAFIEGKHNRMITSTHGTLVLLVHSNLKIYTHLSVIGMVVFLCTLSNFDLFSGPVPCRSFPLQPPTALYPSTRSLRIPSQLFGHSRTFLAMLTGARDFPVTIRNPGASCCFRYHDHPPILQVDA